MVLLQLEVLGRQRQQLLILQLQGLLQLEDSVAIQLGLIPQLAGGFFLREEAFLGVFSCLPGLYLFPLRIPGIPGLLVQRRLMSLLRLSEALLDLDL